MIIPEFIRLLGERGIDFDEAAEIVSHVCAYTNHTILAEALEKWPIHYLEDIVPQLVPIIRKLDEKVKAKYPAENLAIIDSNNLVHMAHMDIHYGFSINGVAALHTEILKNSELHQFYEIYPEKFNNKTNGITFRRWLMYCNQPLTKFISSLIGEGYKKDADELKKLLAYKDDQKGFWISCLRSRQMQRRSARILFWKIPASRLMKTVFLISRSRDFMSINVSS